MTDKELLELAAKAAGIEIKWGIIEGGKQLAPPTKCFYRNQYGIRSEWNPLQDDGDALRLAVKLNLMIEIQDDMVVVYDKFGNRLADDDQFENKNQVVRNEIVNAAAEIGKSQG